MTSTKVDVVEHAEWHDSPQPVGSHSSAAGLLTLTASDGSEPTREYVLDGRNVTIGRAPACTVSLPDDQLASRLHAMLHFTGELYTISDLGSSNGTLVNGTLIRGATPLATGDRVTVGQHTLAFACEPGTEVPESNVTLDEAQAQTSAPMLDPMTTAALEVAAPDAPEPAPAPVGQAWARPVDAEASGNQEPEPVTAPLPTWQSAGSDPWVMPAPPKWATGPASDTWSPPLEQPVAEPTAEAVAPSIESGRAPADQPPASPWAVQVSQPDEGSEPAFEEGPATGELEALRGQLVRSSELLSRWTHTAATQTRHLRGELAALAQDIAIVVEGALGRRVGTEDSLAELIRLADDAARDPHHVNTVVALAARSGDVARILRAEHELLATLERVHVRLDELARQEAL
jgi:pSer/pThr/pTyr-binding forkhead associated (FHA) protein